MSWKRSSTYLLEYRFKINIGLANIKYKKSIFIAKWIGFGTTDAFWGYILGFLQKQDTGSKMKKW
jgi:hypothetical protein